MLNITSRVKIDADYIKSPNLTDLFTQDELDAIGQDCWSGWQIDEMSREDWLRRSEAGMELAMQIQKEKTYPWPGASNVIFPLISIAALQFSARAYGNIIAGPDLVDYQILTGDVEQPILDRAMRISKHMSFQLLQQDTAWEEQHDRLFINVSIVGTTFIKSRYAADRRHNVGELVFARDLCVNYWAKDIASAPRATQRISMTRNEIVGMVRRGAMKDILEEEWYKSPPPRIPNTNTDEDARRGLTQPESDADTPLLWCEQYRNLDLDCDGYSEPYIITFDRFSRKVTRLVLNVDRPEDIERNEKREIVTIRASEYYTKYSFIPAPDGGFYDTGFGILMGPLNEGVNTTINQLIDAGTLANLGGGFLGRGAKFKSGTMNRKPGEWSRVDATGDDLRKSLIPFPETQPSNVLFQLLGLLIEYTNLLAGSTDSNLGKNPGQNTPAETSRNMADSGLQVYSTIFKRIWRSMKEEFRKYHILNRTYLPAKTIFGHGKNVVTREDYLTNPDWVRPAADPNIISAGQRLSQAMTIREAALNSPGGYDMQAVERNFLRSLRVQNLEQLFPGYEAFPPGENYKITIEKMKNEVRQMEIQFESQSFAAELQEALRLNTAKIALLEAQAFALLEEVQIEKRAEAINRFNDVINGLKTHGSIMNEKLKAIMHVIEGHKDKEGRIGETGHKRIRHLVTASTNGSASPSSAQMAGGDQGAVGIGADGHPAGM